MSSLSFTEVSNCQRIGAKKKMTIEQTPKINKSDEIDSLEDDFSDCANDMEGSAIQVITQTMLHSLGAKNYF